MKSPPDTASDAERRDEVLRRMLHTPPKPHKDKPKDKLRPKPKKKA